MRRLASDAAFDFSKPYKIDFNIDFEDWPPSTGALTAIRKRYPDSTVYAPDADSPGYVLFQVSARISYELIVRIQREMSEAMKPFGGICRSWGVLV